MVKLARKKRTVGLKTHLKGYNIAMAKHLYSHQDLSSKVRKTEAGIVPYVDMQP